MYSYDMKPIWAALMEMYDVFSKICEKHNLRYYVYWGTLLGAIRHKDFIPWDDDFDVVMPREDYEKLIEVAPKELPEHLQFLSWKTNPEFYYVFNKIKHKDENFVETLREQSKLKLSTGLYLDIFPLDGAPSSKLGEIFYWSKRRCLRSVGLFILLIKERRFICKYIPLYILGMLFFPFYSKVKSSDEMNHEIEKWAQSYPYSDDKKSVYCQGDVTFFNPPEAFSKAIMMDFCLGRKVPVPHKYDEILRGLYGDYMSLPPEDQRIPKHHFS